MYYVENPVYHVEFLTFDTGLLMSFAAGRKNGRAAPVSPFRLKIKFSHNILRYKSKRK